MKEAERGGGLHPSGPTASRGHELAWRLETRRPGYTGWWEPSGLRDSTQPSWRSHEATKGRRNLLF